MKYDPETHHRRSIRLSGYDYKKTGFYFITICIKNSEILFGEIVGAGLASAQISLTEVGIIIEKNLNSIPNNYNNIFLDEYIIMPNHIHFILVIDSEKRADARPAPTTTIADIICSFKSKCFNDNLKRIKDNELNEIAKFWQRNYYEHIIKNEKDLNMKRQYIKDNPFRWEEDENNPLNINRE